MREDVDVQENIVVKYAKKKHSKLCTWVITEINTKRMRSLQKDLENYQGTLIENITRKIEKKY